MILTDTPLPGVRVVESPAQGDDRGHFRRSWCAETFAAAGLDFRPVQASLSTNPHRHTLRGLHFQTAPHAEAKLVRCLSGAIFDVALDLRPESPTFRRWHGVTLTAEAGNAFFLPKGLAHGFLSLTPDAVVEYLIDHPYQPQAARGWRWDDPAFAIDWPAPPALISDRDRSWPDFPHG